MLVILSFLIILINSSAGYHDDTANLKCPFLYRHKRPCLRRSYDIQYYADEYDVKRNSRPDIDLRTATREEIRSERTCCYEVHCLADCRIDHLAFSDFVDEKLDLVDRLVSDYPNFWKNVNQTEIDMLNDGTASNMLKNHWRVKLADFEAKKKEFNEARQTLKKLDKIFL